MNNYQPKNRIIFGVILLIFGVLTLVDNLNIFSTRDIFQFWPTVFILVGALKISKGRTVSGNLVGGGFVAVGVLLILQHLGIIYFRARDWWPALLILAGLFVILKDKLNVGNDWETFKATDSQDPTYHITAFMSGAKMQNFSPDFRGGELTAVMGGISLDLTKASMQTDAVLNVFAMWGGIELRVPPDWTVILQGVPILGGIEDKTIPPMTQNKKLHIQGYAIMGGVEIKN